MGVLAVAKLLQAGASNGELLGQRTRRIAALRSHAATCVSYAATCAKASAASRCRVSRATDPCSRSSRSTAPYCVGRDHHGDRIAVLGSRADQVGPPMSMFSTIGVVISTTRERLGEGVEGHDDEIDRLEVALGELAHVLGDRHAGRGCRAWIARMQRSDAPVEHLRESGDVGDGQHLDACIGERPAGAAVATRSSRGRSGRGRSRSARSCR